MTFLGTGMDFFSTVPRPHFLGYALISPAATSASMFSVFLDYILRICQSLCDSLVSISSAILFLRSWHVYFPLEFEFRGKRCVEREHGGEDGISCLLLCILLLYIV